MADFLQEIAPLLEIEGGLNTNKADRGGLTKYGISQKSYPKLDIASLTPEKAAQIYKRDYWDKIGGDKLPPATAAVAFDAAVNHGVGKAKALLMYSGGDPQKMIAKRKSLYDKIAQQDPSQRQFHNGWINRLETLGGRVSSMLNPISTAQADETPWQEPDIEGLHHEFAQWKQAQQPNVADLHNEFAQWKQSQPKEKTAGQKVGEVITDIGGGVLKGASNIGNTLLSAGDTYNEFVGNKNALSSLDTTGEERRAQATEGIKSMGANPESTAFKVGELGTEIAGTAGMGSALAAGAKGIPMASKLAPSLESWGMKGANIAQKAAGGAITGGASSALLDPGTAGTGAVIGAALPPAIAVAGKAGEMLGSGIRSLATPQIEKIASKIVDATGKSKEEVIDLLTNQARVDELPDLIRTVPQILQDPNISQLARTIKTNSNMQLANAEAAQQNVFKGALESIAPSNMTVQDAADKAGSAISKSVQGDYKAATKAVSEKFNALRNNTEKNITLPIDKLRGTVDEYLGKGTVGKGSDARNALRVAEDLSEVKPIQGILPEQEKIIGAAKTPWHKQPIDTEKDNMLTAITKLGGINKELAQSTYGNRMWEDVPTSLNTFRNQGGHSLDDMATMLSEKGYLPEGSGVYELTEKLYGNAKDTYSMAKSGYGYLDAPMTAQDQLHQQLGDLITELQKKNAPKAAKDAIEKLPRDLSGKVSFKELQNLRSSIGDLAQQAKLSGKNTENAALKQMVTDIDTHLDDLANSVDGMTSDTLKAYKEARAMHKAKMDRFKTGAQSGLFKPKSNGQMAVEGGEIPGKFYSSKASQSRDVKDFKRLVNNKDELIKELKEFALTKAGQTATANGNLSQGYVKWAKGHSGANNELFTSAEKAKIDAIAREITLASKAENLGRVTGSDTAQKLKSITDLGLIDNKAVNLLMSKIPAGNALLAGLKDASAKERANIIADLLADPEKLKKAMETTARKPGKIGRLGKGAASAALRSVPVLSQQ